MNIVILEESGYSKKALDIYSSFSRVIFGYGAVFPKSDVDGLVVRLGYKIDKNFLSDYSTLKFIASPTTGVNHIDMEYCSEAGIKVFTLRDTLEEIKKITSTSELTFGLIISLLRGVNIACSDVVIRRNWNRDSFKSMQLSSLRLGIIGLGRIGGHVASYASAFKMETFAYDPYQIDEFFDLHKVNRCESIEDLLSRVDIVTIHVNLSQDTYHLLGAREIKFMRAGTLLINTSRGEIVNEKELVQALREGKVGGVAVDVIESEGEENFLQNSPLITAAREGHNVIVTPHIGGCTYDAMHITEEIIANHVKRMMASSF